MGRRLFELQKLDYKCGHSGVSGTRSPRRNCNVNIMNNSLNSQLISPIHPRPADTMKTVGFTNATPFLNITEKVIDVEATQELLRLVGTSVIGCLLTFVILVGNLIVLVVFRTDRQLRRKNYYFIYNLAIADFIVGLNSVPGYTAYLAIGYWPFGRIACDIWLIIDYVACAVSLFTIIVITVDRYMSLSNPIAHVTNMPKSRVLTWIVTTWAIAIVLYGLPIFLWPRIHGFYEYAPETCVIDYLSHTWFTWIQTVLGFWLPMSVLVVLYIRIYMFASHVTLRKRKYHAKFVGHAKKKSSELKVTSISDKVHQSYLSSPSGLKVNFSETELEMFFESKGAVKKQHDEGTIYAEDKTDDLNYRCMLGTETTPSFMYINQAFRDDTSIHHSTADQILSSGTLMSSLKHRASTLG
uniref:Muscarinic acetylcholine receptor gar-3-like n=1 Tax=Saccoglossus kowalevskii TaxID=10224 RepID=A0ABM0MFK2_SACKO|nr:PREDICTED: muscarinic acetylcholine receptor gar-3-like [Saccoglossus kowalevskii]